MIYQISKQMNSEDKHIWAIIVNLAIEHKRYLIDINDDYKQQLIKGYKICKEKTYNFKSVEEEEQYFMRSDVTPEEEVYYYEFIVVWSENAITLSDIGIA